MFTWLKRIWWTIKFGVCGKCGSENIRWVGTDDVMCQWYVCDTCGHGKW